MVDLKSASPSKGADSAVLSAGTEWIPSLAGLEAATEHTHRAADDIALHRVRKTMTRWMALAGCGFATPVIAAVLVQRPQGFDPLVTLMMCAPFPAALLLVERHPRHAGTLVSLAYFSAVAVGGYYNLGSAAVTINAAYALCIVIASACWSTVGGFSFAVLSGVLAAYAATTHSGVPAQDASLAGAKVAIMLLVLAGVQHGLLTALVRARGRVLAHEERLESLIHQSPDGMLVLDEQRRIRLANPSAAALVGRRAQGLLGNRIDGLSWLDDASLARLKPPAGERPEATQVELVSRDGQQVVEGRLSTLTRREGNWKYLLVLHDVSAQRADARAREEVQRRIRESTSLESLGRLAGGIAHDFNNLLTVILNTTELAEMGPGLPGELASDLKTVRTAAQRAAELTHQLLTVARRQVLRPKVLCLNEIIEEMSPLLQRLVPESVHMQVSCAPDLGNVRADPAQLGQVLVNLVTNAVDAMDEDGGMLTIESRNVRLDDDYASAHPNVEPGEYVQLAVSDTGLGMSADTLSRIFEPFFTTKSKERGTGLGLATVHGIVRQSGGHVYVYSEHSEGTTFRVYLPRANASAAGQEAEPGARAETRLLRVLLVEDQAEVRASVGRMLRHLGHRVWLARHAESALARYGQRAGEIDLLLTDVVMPGLKGPKLAEALRARNAQMRVLYMSGYTENAIVHGGALDPGVHYLAKPFDLASLRGALAEACEPRR